MTDIRKIIIMEPGPEALRESDRAIERRFIELLTKEHPGTSWQRVGPPPSYEPADVRARLEREARALKAKYPDMEIELVWSEPPDDGPSRA